MILGQTHSVRVDMGGGEALHVSYRFSMNQLERLDMERQAVSAADAVDAAQRRLDTAKARLAREHAALLSLMEDGSDEEIAQAEQRCNQWQERVKAAQAALDEAVQRSLELQNKLFCSIIADWDISENGQKLPVTPETVARLPMEAVRRILEAVRADQGEGLGVRSGSGSPKRAS